MMAFFPGQIELQESLTSRTKTSCWCPGYLLHGVSTGHCCWLSDPSPS